MSFLQARKIERTFLILLTVVFGLLFYRLSAVQQDNLKEVSRRLADSTIMNLNGPSPEEHISTLLRKGNYYQDPRDIAFIAHILSSGLKRSVGKIDNVGELNKMQYNVSIDNANNNGGNSFKSRIEVSKSLLGFTGEDSVLYKTEKTKPLNVGSINNASLGSEYVDITVTDGNDQPTGGVLVRLAMVPPDSIISDEDESKTLSKFTNGLRKIFQLDSAQKPVLQSFQIYARTDASGNAHFKGLIKNEAYEILPLEPGYQFGKSQGVKDLDGRESFSFIRLPQTIRLFSSHDFSILKKEKAFIVRTPEEATSWFLIIAVCFFASFFLIHLLLSVRFPNADQILVPVIMILTGLSFLTLLSLQDPVRDRFLAKSTLYYFEGGILSIIILMLFNFKKFTTDSWFYRLIIFKSINKAANGFPWALAAMGLLVLTILFGTGPEGSGVKVNLLGFQPSEIVKFLVVFFLAGFFATNEKFISEYFTFQKRLRFFSFALFSIVLTFGLFLILGDLGPAIICCFTFIILFSFSRGDFPEMAVTILFYVLSIWLLKNIWFATALVIGAGIVYYLIKRKQISESAIMAVVIIAGFMILDKVPHLDKLFPGPVQRLIDRKAIWQDPWNNEVYGGDQVANGIWAMASGGMTGQGTGEGLAKTIPEAHTDMILPAMGEEFGLTGIVCIFLLFLLFFHRSIIIGRQTGRPFLFYLCAGIGLANFIQFILIAGGSTSALPLSGVALPFMSYGGSSLLSNMLAAGILLTSSHLQGTEPQMKYISKKQDNNLLPALLAAFGSIFLLILNISGYSFNNQKWVVEPALVAQKNGSRMFSYNPRINILMNKLQAGNLLDRKGRIVASSEAQPILAQEDSLLKAGADRELINSLIYKRQDRYYPFADQMFFWTGDANSGVFSGSSNGYFAEYSHASELRGFPTPVSKTQVVATRYRGDRFLPQTRLEMTVNKINYSALSSLLLAGIKSKDVEIFKSRNRDVQLTIDASLQSHIQQAIQADDSANTKRVSVVVMEDYTGDVLASAMYPLPPINDWEKLTLSESELNKLPGWNVNTDMGFTHATQPGSTAKLITALAAFNKLGEAAATKIIHIYPWDLIRTKGLEPDEAGDINIERAIVKSNNSFFIRIANEQQLQEQMGDIYLTAGLFLHGVGGYYYDGESTNNDQVEKWKTLWRKTEFTSIKRYDPNNIRRTRAKGVSGMAWGQGELIATPAAIARVATSISNNGTLVANRFVMKVSGVDTKIKPGVQVTGDPHFAQLMTSYMIKQSASKVGKLGISVAGKTGTPERVFRGQKINDGWYVFFAPSPSGKGNIVTCIRVEDAIGSSEAVKLAGKDVIPILLQMGYIKSIDSGIQPGGQ
ncbi:MAG: hypothetical protein NVSMB45_03400 [Ginsengibacter sp.]